MWTFLALLVGLSQAVVIDRVVDPVSKWTQIGRSNGNTNIRLLFAVKQQNVPALETLLMDVSTPGNDEYGHFRSIEEINKIVAPLPKSIRKVKSWLMRNGISKNQIKAETTNEDYLSVEVTISKAESLLQCEYYDYKSVKNENLIVSRVKMGTNYEVPDSVASHLDYISPTKRFPSTKEVSLSAGNLGATNTPERLRTLYNVDAKGVASNNIQGVASFVDQYYSQEDLTAFWKRYNIETDNVTNVPSNTESGHKLEATLDTQYITSLGEGISLQVWYNKGAFDEAMSNWLIAVQNAANPPLIFSVSYGEQENQWGEAAVNRLNTEFAKVGALGISVFFASGDSGAGADCVDGRFEPDYPACSPYVTAVGGLTGGKDAAPIGGETGERVWTEGGGGFSNFAATQSWQQTAVTHYLNSDADLPPSDKYNATGRGFPDISAQSTDFVIESRGNELEVDGTSCASPTAAGIFALLNDLRLQNNMKQLGFANPFIYTTAANDSTAFSDCTSGYNRGCTGATEGFPAVAKWDAASGWGSPDYAVLKGHVLKTGQTTKKWV